MLFWNPKRLQDSYRVDVREITVQARRNIEPATIFPILAAISFCHLLNDMVQSLITAIYPILKSSFHLDFAQVGLITLTYQMTASLLQPVVGFYTDLRPKPFSLPIGMSFTLVGLVLLSRAPNFPLLLVPRPLDCVMKFVSGLLAGELPVDSNAGVIHAAIPSPGLFAQRGDVRDPALAQALPGE